MLNLNYNLNSSNIERSRFTEQENEGFRKFQIQYVIVPGGGGAAAGNNEFNYGTALPKFGIAGNGGVVVTGSYCVEPFGTYPIVVGSGGLGGSKGTTGFQGFQGNNSAFFNIEAIGGTGGQTQLYTSASGLAGNGSQTIAVVANGGSGSQWTYNLPGCLPYPGTGCHGGDLISSSYYSGGGPGVFVSQSFVPTVFDYLIVGGGGSGIGNGATSGVRTAGGGSGGGVISGSFDYSVFPTLNSYKSGSNYVFNIVVGQGGAGVVNADARPGSSSAAFGWSVSGGGGGITGIGFDTLSGTGSANSNFTEQFSGSCGGAGARANGGSCGGDGSVPNPWRGGNGGNGALWSGSYYAAGAAGCLTPGNGDVFCGTSGLGINNYGSGGAGAFVNGTSGAGQNGVVIVKYFGVKKPFINGGAVSYDGTYTTHLFESSSQLVVSPSIPTLDVEFLVVGGGGGAMTNEINCNNGAGYGGGGGAAISASFQLQPLVQSYPIVIGSGGAGKYACSVNFASNGNPSTVFGVSAQGGRGANSGNTAGNSGTGSIKLLTPFIGPSSSIGAGGGGAAQNGTAGTNLGGGNYTAGNGGNGLQWLDGNYYAGGGFGGIMGNQQFVGSYGATTEQYGYYPGRGGGAQPGNIYFPQEMDGKAGAVVIRYYGTGSKATGGIVSYDLTTGYTYHFFSQSGNFTLLESAASMFTSGIPGEGDGNSIFSVSGSSWPIANTGGGAAASSYNQNGARGSDGFVAIRYEGAPLADGGNIITTQYYTYHLFSSSADFYVIGQESNPNINPCP